MSNFHLEISQTQKSLQSFQKKSSDKSLEENTEKEHSSEVKSSETQTSSETAPSSSADDNLENNNENNQTSQNTAADTAAVSDSAEITSSAGSTEPSSLKEESSTQEKSVDEVETESESETETEKESQTEYESETESETKQKSQTEKESLETETKTASTEQEKTSLEQTETSTQDVENKTEAESETETERQKLKQNLNLESEMETEAESESDEDNTNPYHEAAKAKYPTPNESYTPIPAVSSGCIYAKYTNFDEAFQTLYTNQSDLSGAAQVALNTPGFNIIGYRVYMLAYQDGILNAYSTQLDGTDLQLSAANVGTEAYIMNGSIFSENREYSMTGDPVGTAYPYIKRFLTFGEDKVYYLDTDGDITRSDYQHTAIQRLELGIDDGNDVAWAQVMGPYLIYYDTKTELMYSCNLDVGTIVLLDFDGVAAPSGLCGNGNWVYGLYDGKLAKVRPNGSELQTIYEPDDSLELVSVGACHGIILF